MNKEQLIFKFKHLPYYLKLLLFDRKRMKSGFIKKKPDERDFKTETLGWSLFGYEPKSEKKIIQTLSVKDQGSNNTCTSQATAVQKEIDENAICSARSLTIAGVNDGLVSGNGFASLDAPQKMLKKYGALEENQCPEVSSWSSYIGFPFSKYIAEYAKHKSQSYWSVSSKADIYKLLDEGKAITTGIDWYTGFNQGGGFSSPWLITKALGYKVGGHALAIIGYIKNYHGYEVFVIQNSYGKGWGDNGKLYISVNYIMANNYGFYANLDIQVDTASFLNKYDGKNVKGKSSTCWFIQAGKKKVYPNWTTYLAWTISIGKELYHLTPSEEEILNKVPNGDAMDITKSVPWNYMKDIANADDNDQSLMNALFYAFDKLGISL